MVSSSPVFTLADMLALGGGHASLGGTKGACHAPLISPNQHMLIGGGVPYGHPCQTTQQVVLRSQWASVGWLGR